MVRVATEIRNGDTIDIGGDHLVVFYLCNERGKVVVDAVSAVSARRYELHYSPDAVVSVL